MTSCSQASLFQRSAQWLREHWRWNERTHILGLFVVALLVFGGLTGCKDRVVIKPLNVAATYPDKFECEKGVEGGRPALPPELAVPDSLANYKEWHKEFLERVRARELVVANYVLALEAVNFKCWDNMQWQKDYYSKLKP